MAIANQGTSEGEINQLNLAMRQTPWFKQYFAQRGLNPDRVKLNDNQRKELTQLASQNGYQLGDRMKFDQAGNINQMGGFAGMPTWAKIAIAAAPVAGSMLIPGVREATIGQLGGIFGGGVPNAVPAVSGSLTSAGTTLAPTVVGTATGAASTLPAVGGLTKAASTLLGGTGGGSGVSKAGDYITNLLNGGKAQNFADAGNLFQRFANDEASHRLNNQNAQSNFEVGKSNQTQAYDRLMLDAARNRRDDESDALKKLNQTAYILGGGSKYTPATIQLNGQSRQLPTFGLPSMPEMTATQREAATELEKTLLGRLRSGAGDGSSGVAQGSYNPTRLDDYRLTDPSTQDYSKRGVGEQVGRWGSIATTGLGFFDQLFNR